MRSGSVKGIVKEGVTGGIAASLISAILVLIFAVICRLTAPSDLVMQLINQVIKGVSIFVGVYLMIKTASAWLSERIGRGRGIFSCVVDSISYSWRGTEFRKYTAGHCHCADKRYPDRCACGQ